MKTSPSDKVKAAARPLYSGWKRRTDAVLHSSQRPVVIGILMKKALLPFAATLAAGLLAGYAIWGRGRNASSSGEEQTGRMNHAKATGESGARASSRSRTSTAGGHAFAPPFSPGQAEGWLESFAHGEQGDDPFSSDYAAATTEFTMICGRLDAGAAEELALACLKANGLSGEGGDADRDPKINTDWLTTVMTRLAELNPSRALALLHHPEGSSMPDWVVAAVFAMVARHDPQQARAALATLAESDRSGALHALTRELLKNDPASALAMLDGMPDAGTEREMCLAALAKTDPERAFSIAIHESSESRISDALTGLTVDSGMRDRIATWVASDQGEENAHARSQAIQILAGHDAALAASLWSRVASSLVPEQQEEAAEAIAKCLSEKDTQQWLDGIGDSSLRQQALSAIIGSTLSRDWITPFPLQTRTTPDSPADVSAVLPIVELPIVTPTSESLAGWMQELAPSPEKDALTLRLIGQLQNMAPDQASLWINTLPDGEQKDFLKQETQLKIELQALQTAHQGNAGR